MYSENGVLVDFAEIRRLIGKADVFVVGFAHFPERLMVDARSDEREMPLVQIVEPVGSPQERVRRLMRRRPTLGTPKSFSFFAWPHSPRFLVESGMWDAIQRRVAVEGEPEAGVQCELAMKQLENLDTAAMLAVLKGENCVTLWPPQADDEDEA